MNALAMILMMAGMALVGGMGLRHHARQPDHRDPSLDDTRYSAGSTNTIHWVSEQSP